MTPQLVTRRRPNGAGLEDHYHQFHLSDPATGKHTVRAVVRAVETKAETSRGIEFEV